MVNFDKARITLPTSVRNTEVKRSAEFKRRREVGRAHEAERVKASLEIFVESPEWQTELQRRSACLTILESMMLRRETAPLHQVQQLWQEESKPSKQREKKERQLAQSDFFMDPPIPIHESIKSLIWETIDGQWFRFDEAGKLATLNESGDEILLELDEATPVRPVYPASSDPRWSALFSDYGILQPFPQLHRLEPRETMRTAEEYTKDYMADIQELRQRWAEIFYEKEIVTTILEGAFYNKKFPGFEIHTRAVDNQKEFCWQVQVEPPTPTLGLRAEQVLWFIQGNDPELAKDNLEILRYQLAELDMIMRKLHEWTEFGEMIDVVLEEMYFEDLNISGAFLRASEELKKKTGKEKEFHQMLAKYAWGIVGEQAVLHFSGGTWYSEYQEYVIGDSDLLRVINLSRTTSQERSACRDLLSSKHPFFEGFIDQKMIKFQDGGYDILEEVEEFKRRSRVVGRFLSCISEETKRSVYSRELSSHIPTPHPSYISRALRTGEFTLPRMLFSPDKNEQSACQANIGKVDRDRWQGILLSLSWLGEFNPHEIDLT